MHGRWAPAVCTRNAAALPLPLHEHAQPGGPSVQLIGATLHAQSLWSWSRAVCSPSPSDWSSPPGLGFTVQP